MKSVEAQCQYEVTTFAEGPDCGVLGPASVHFFGLNEHGQACGRRSICGEVGQWLPIVWTEAHGLITLPLPEGATQGEANDINNVLGSDGFGQVACTLSFTGEGNRACLYDDGTWTVLDSENSKGLTEAFAINDDGWIAGYRDTQEGRKAVRWRGEVVQQIASPFGNGAIARSLNEDGHAVGAFGSLNAKGRGFLWERGRVTLIPTLVGGSSSEARSVNRFDIVTGQGFSQPKRTDPIVVRSFVSEGFVLEDIGVLPINTFTRAAAINDARQIVGVCHNQGLVNNRSFLWQGGELMRLKDLTVGVPGFFELSAAKAINNRGQIAGYTGGSAEGVILTPIVPLGDINFDCEVDADDLIAVLDAWGPCDDAGSIADIVTSQSFQPPADGIVDGADLAVVLGNWSLQLSPSLPNGKRSN